MTNVVIVIIQFDRRSFCNLKYVDHATRKLRLIVDLTSANCSHQVQQ